MTKNLFFISNIIFAGIVFSGVALANPIKFQDSDSSEWGSIEWNSHMNATLEAIKQNEAMLAFKGIGIASDSPSVMSQEIGIAIFSSLAQKIKRISKELNAPVEVDGDEQDINQLRRKLYSNLMTMASKLKKRSPFDRAASLKLTDYVDTTNIEFPQIFGSGRAVSVSGIANIFSTLLEDMIVSATKAGFAPNQFDQFSKEYKKLPYSEQFSSLHKTIVIQTIAKHFNTLRPTALQLEQFLAEHRFSIEDQQYLFDQLAERGLIYRPLSAWWSNLYTELERGKAENDGASYHARKLAELTDTGIVGNPVLLLLTENRKPSSIPVYELSEIFRKIWNKFFTLILDVNDGLPSGIENIAEFRAKKTKDLEIALFEMMEQYLVQSSEDRSSAELIEIAKIFQNGLERHRERIKEHQEKQTGLLESKMGNALDLASAKAVFKAADLDAALAILNNRGLWSAGKDPTKSFNMTSSALEKFVDEATRAGKMTDEKMRVLSLMTENQYGILKALLPRVEVAVPDIGTSFVDHRRAWLIEQLGSRIEGLLKLKADPKENFYILMKVASRPLAANQNEVVEQLIDFANLIIEAPKSDDSILLHNILIEKIETDINELIPKTRFGQRLSATNLVALSDILLKLEDSSVGLPTHLRERVEKIGNTIIGSGLNRPQGTLAFRASTMIAMDRGKNSGDQAGAAEYVWKHIDKFSKKFPKFEEASEVFKTIGLDAEGKQKIKTDAYLRIAFQMADEIDQIQVVGGFRLPRVVLASHLKNDINALRDEIYANFEKDKTGYLLKAQRLYNTARMLGSMKLPMLDEHLKVYDERYIDEVARTYAERIKKSRPHFADALVSFSATPKQDNHHAYVAIGIFLDSDLRDPDFYERWMADGEHGDLKESYALIWLGHLKDTLDSKQSLSLEEYKQYARLLATRSPIVTDVVVGGSFAGPLISKTDMTEATLINLLDRGLREHGTKFIAALDYLPADSQATIAYGVRESWIFKNLDRLTHSKQKPMAEGGANLSEFFNNVAKVGSLVESGVATTATTDQSPSVFLGAIHASTHSSLARLATLQYLQAMGKRYGRISGSLDDYKRFKAILGTDAKLLGYRLNHVTANDQAVEMTLNPGAGFEIAKMSTEPASPVLRCAGRIALMLKGFQP